MDFCEIVISNKPLAVPPPSDDAQACGAVIDFWGIVRPEENGLVLTGIAYEAHPRLAEKELRAIAVEVASRHSALHGCRVWHRVGFIPAGEASLFLRAIAPHRDEAYAASRALIELLKLRAPIWKRPIFDIRPT